jgi:hypothetical protein
MIIVILLIILIISFFLRKSSFELVQKIALVSLIHKPKNIETWLKIHRDLGISRFYIQLENTPELVDFLKSQPDVTLTVFISNDSNQYTTLQKRQTGFTNKILKICKEDWLIHIDSDEILHGNLSEIFSLPENVQTFWMQNVEAVYDDIPTSSDNCFQAIEYRDCSKSGSGCVSYINGKGGGRVVPGVESNGPHRFKSINGIEVKLKMVVRHYESCDFDQYVKKFSRLSKGAKLNEIPFEYYRDSILANGNVDTLKEVYKQYRVR